MQEALSRFRVAGPGTSAIRCALRSGWFKACQPVKIIWFYREILNELDALTDADLRDLAIGRRDITRIAWDEARQRAARLNSHV
jgi:uncharacterized protein YjiS (DUF1127 family)